MGSFWEYFLFYGLAGFYTAWLEGIGYLLVQESFRFSSELWRQFQYILSRQLLSWNPALLLRPEFGIRSPSSHGDLCPQNWFLSFYFRWRKKKLIPFLGLWPLIRLLSLSTPCQAISFRLLYVPYTPFFIHPVTECNISWLSFWPGFVTSVAMNRPIFLIPLLTVSLWRPVNSNTEG